MRTYQLSAFLILTFALFLTSCQNSDSKRIRDQARQTLPEVNPNSFANASAATAENTVAFNAAEPHYKCPNNCVGGTGADKGTCPVCGTEMAHNAAYHNTAANTTNPNTPTLNDLQTNTPASAFNTAEPHYKCPNNCTGGSGPAKGSCPVCGTEMAHNAAYHSAASTTSPTTTSPAAPALNTNTVNTTTTSAQNAAGVFHYTCSNGCAGGAASAVACSTCGSTLVHNTAYHGN